MAMDPPCANDRGDPLQGPVEPGDDLFTGGCEVLPPGGAQAPGPSRTAARRVVCTRLRGDRRLAFLGDDQAVVGTIPELPRPGRSLRVYSAAGVCVLRSSRIRLLSHGPQSTVVVTRNSTYRVDFVDDA
jgi:hypothetical protein